MRRILTIAACAALAFTACGGGDGDIADELIDDAKDEGIELDEECVRREAARFSDDDIDAFRDEDTEAISPEGQEILFDLFNCVTDEEFNQSLEDDVMAQLPDNVDAECVLEAVGDLSGADLADPANAGAMADAIQDCTDG